MTFATVSKDKLLFERGVSKECLRLHYARVLLHVVCIRGRAWPSFTIGSNSCASTHTYVHTCITRARILWYMLICTYILYYFFGASFCSYLRCNNKLLRSAKISFMPAALLQFNKSITQ